jgi:hypothetical protein
MNPRTIFEQHTMSAPTVVMQGLRVTPEATVLSLRLPFGGFVWSRPRAVLVEHAGQIKRVPIADVTRLVQLALWACALVCVWLSRIATEHRKEHAS